MSFHSIYLISFSCQHLLPDNYLSTVVSSSSFRLPHDSVASALMQLLATILGCLAKHSGSVQASNSSTKVSSGKSSNNNAADNYTSRAGDIVRYKLFSKPILFLKGLGRTIVISTLSNFPQPILKRI